MKQGKNHPTPSKRSNKIWEIYENIRYIKRNEHHWPPYYIILLRFVERSRTLYYSTSNWRVPKTIPSCWMVLINHVTSFKRSTLPPPFPPKLFPKNYSISPGYPRNNWGRNCVLKLYSLYSVDVYMSTRIHVWTSIIYFTIWYFINQSIWHIPIDKKTYHLHARPSFGSLSVMMVMSSTPARPAMRYMVRASLVQVSSDAGAYS